MTQKPPRPTGVAVLAILDIIGGVLSVLGGLFLAAVGGSSILVTYGFSSALSGAVAFIGGIFAVVGVFALIVGWGLWSGKGWAWVLAMVLYSIGALFSLVSLALGSIGSVVLLLLDVLILWYLLRPHVREYFKGATAPVAPSPPPPPPATTA